MNRAELIQRATTGVALDVSNKVLSDEGGIKLHKYKQVTKSNTGEKGRFVKESHSVHLYSHLYSQELAKSNSSEIDIATKEQLAEQAKLNSINTLKSTPAVLNSTSLDNGERKLEVLDESGNTATMYDLMGLVKEGVVDGVTKANSSYARAYAKANDGYNGVSPFTGIYEDLNNPIRQKQITNPVSKFIDVQSMPSHAWWESFIIPFIRNTNVDVASMHVGKKPTTLNKNAVTSFREFFQWSYAYGSHNMQWNLADIESANAMIIPFDKMKEIVSATVESIEIAKQRYSLLGNSTWASSDIYGLLNHPNIETNTGSIIQKPFSAQTLQEVIETARRMANYASERLSQVRDANVYFGTLVVPLEEYRALMEPTPFIGTFVAQGIYNYSTKFDVLKAVLSTLVSQTETGNIPELELLPLQYCDSAYNDDIVDANTFTYMWYNKTEKAGFIREPIERMILTPPQGGSGFTVDGFNFESNFLWSTSGLVVKNPYAYNKFVVNKL